MEQKILGKKIEELRKRKGLTQEELVKETNISIRSIQRIEKGEVKPRAFTLKILSEALGYNLLEFNNGYKVSIWVVVIHLSNIIPIVLIPLIVWLLKRDESDTIYKHGAKVINYQILLLIISAGYFIFSRSFIDPLSLENIEVFIRISTSFNIAYWGLNLLFIIANLIWTASGSKIIYPGIPVIRL